MAEQVENIKWIPGTKFIVDGFRFQSPRCQVYLLTHFHSDHTTGLNKSFGSGTIFCTPVTATLLMKDMGMPAHRICPIPLDKPTTIDGVEITPMDANHCPGACMFLFKVPQKGPMVKGKPKHQVILHTGDMRWKQQLGRHPALKGLKIDLLFLDTTYASPKHVHPPQEQALASMVDVMRTAHRQRPSTLFVVGSYHIGKERAYLGAAAALGWKVWAPAAKRRVLGMLDLPKSDMALLATKPEAAKIHVTAMGLHLQPEALSQKIAKSRHWSHVVAFRPTGWTFKRSGGLEQRTEGNVTIYGIPYSEHSSFTELRECVAALRPKKLVPTVNAPNAAASRALVDRFADLMDLSADKSRLDMYFKRGSGKLGLTERHASAPVPAIADAPDAYFAASTMRHAESMPAAALPTQHDDPWTDEREACASADDDDHRDDMPGGAETAGVLQEQGSCEEAAGGACSRDDIDEGYQDWADEGYQDDGLADEGCADIMKLEADLSCCSEGVVGDAIEETAVCGPCALESATELCSGRTGGGSHDVVLVKQESGLERGEESLPCIQPAGQAEFDMDVVNIAEQASILAMIQAKQRQKHDTAIQQQHRRRRLC